MKSAKKFGLIGKNISYSFSRKYFGDKFHRLMLKDHSYEVFDIDNLETVTNLFKTENLVGLNVTIPYKEQIMDFLDEVSDEAQKIGAVNTILIKNGRTKGYNTDAAGFEKSFRTVSKNHDDAALVLGNGGAAKAVQYVFDKLQIPYKTVSRKGALTFENLSSADVAAHQIIVQCTPVGTYPKTEECLPFPFEALTENHLVIDLIYNPNETRFIKNAAAYGARTFNGLYMLELQAEKAWEIWNL